MTSLNVSSTFGVIYWGFVVATVLLGTSIIQGYFFFLGNKISWELKAFVVLLLTLNFATTALSSGYLNYYLIIFFGDPLALLDVTKPYIAEYVVTVFIILLAQLFYAWRIYAGKVIIRVKCAESLKQNISETTFFAAFYNRGISPVRFQRRFRQVNRYFKKLLRLRLELNHLQFLLTNSSRSTA
ncbi:hypothetical protein EW145_g7102 [Phellinidium pouzarii]|uniref:Uncharacterized protein n=1 Tax=Phellinidium pouzarii TaxID=167371 RepID=A0A4S4KTN8_9AGAM|nr:hypothetical protein EW145_g7102 [Phellinidium pouzarii]